MNRRHIFYSLPVILLLIVVAAGWFATDYLGNKARKEITEESQASILTLSVYVSSTFTNIEGAVKSLAGSPWIAPALISKRDRDPTLDVNLQAGLHSMMSAPLISRDKAIGALVFRAQKQNAYTEQDLRLAEKIGTQIAAAIANAQLFTDLKRMEISLRESEKRFKQIVEVFPETIFEANPKGDITYANEHGFKQFGYAAEDIASGVNIINMISPDDRNQVLQRIFSTSERCGIITRPGSR